MCKHYLKNKKEMHFLICVILVFNHISIQGWFAYRLFTNCKNTSSMKINGAYFFF